MADLRKLLSPFAVAIIHARSEAIRDWRSPPGITARFLESISDDIKKCGNFFAPYVSVAAKDKATRRGIDLTEKNWHDQPLFGKGRKLFQFEHLVPVSSLRADTLVSRTAADILNILMTRLRVVWMLKAEDAELGRMGYRSRRKGPVAAYRAAEIKIAAQHTPADAPNTARR